MSVKTLVIGGTRFIGPYVVRELAAHGHDVTVFHRGTHNVNLADAREIRSPAAAMPIKQFPEEVRALEPQIVINMIPMGRDDARATLDAFGHSARRVVMVSSCDVYLAYGRFRRTEPGDTVEMPLREDSPLRALPYPYRTPETARDAYEYDYEKIFMEEAAMSFGTLATALRLPKVYGHEDNAALATVYGAAHAPDWRWTHGFVENVAHAIALAAIHPAAAGRIYNVGEAVTPSVAERLRYLPAAPASTQALEGYDFRHHLHLDTTRIREELGFTEVRDEREAMCSVVEGVLREERRR